ANWTVAVLLNDCSVPTVGVFCFTNPNLDYNNLHIEFGEGVEGGSLVTSTKSSYPWSGQWHSYIRYRGEPRPDDHYFNFTFKKQANSKFKVPYVLYPTDGQPKVFFLELENNEGRFYVDNFGYTNEQLIIIPVNLSLNVDQTYSYTTTGELSTSPIANTTESVPASDQTLGISEGSLIRAEGGSKVYIVKGKYKRWIQTAELFNMYGHLRWEDIIDVPQNILNQYTESTLVRADGDERVFFTTIKGQKRWIQTADELIGLGFNFDMVYIINETELNWFRTI
ncbi:MAG: hypothetical protein R3346_04850, partial [Candidatus Spechtbacterales bacterium]|nr:hypothetical protein [Candidatus Spechtbacterales bacterium]